MTAIEAAVERGRGATKGSRYEPVTVDHNGRPTARIRDTRSGAIEGVYKQGGNWYFAGLGLTRGGEPTAPRTAPAELKRIAKAMLFGPDRNDLINESRAATFAARTGGSRKGRVRRKR